jgi:hypothetical protein
MRRRADDSDGTRPLKFAQKNPCSWDAPSSGRDCDAPSNGSRHRVYLRQTSNRARGGHGTRARSDLHLPLPRVSPHCRDSPVRAWGPATAGDAHAGCGEPGMKSPSRTPGGVHLAQGEDAHTLATTKRTCQLRCRLPRKCLQRARCSKEPGLPAKAMYVRAERVFTR